MIASLERAMQETAEIGLEMIRKSQMSLDFSGPDPHHVAYTRISRSGAVSQVKAKGNKWYLIREPEGDAELAGKGTYPTKVSAMASVTGNYDRGKKISEGHHALMGGEGTTSPKYAIIHTDLMNEKGYGYLKEPEEKHEPTYKEMTARLKDDGIWIAATESMGLRHKHSKWYIHWNDSDHGEHIETDGTDGGSTKAWQEKLAKETATKKRYDKEYPAPEPYHATPSIPKMAALIAENNLDYNEFETKYDRCDACGEKKDVRTVHDADNGGDTLYGEVCDDCLDKAHRQVSPTVPAPDTNIINGLKVTPEQKEMYDNISAEMKRMDDNEMARFGGHIHTLDMARFTESDVRYKKAKIIRSLIDTGLLVETKGTTVHNSYTQRRNYGRDRSQKHYEYTNWHIAPADWPHKR